MRNPLPPCFAVPRRLNMSGVQKGKDGKTPSGNSEDPKCEGKGARPKEFEKRERKSPKSKKKVHSAYVKGQGESRITERKSDNFIPQVLVCPRKLFESTEDVKHTVVRPESKPVVEKVSPKSKVVRDKETKPRVLKPTSHKLYIDPDDSRRQKVSSTPPRKLWTDPDESKSVFEKVSPKSPKGAYSAESQGRDLTEARDKETQPQEPVSPFSKLTLDPEEHRRRNEISPGKLWEDPDRIRLKRKEKSSEPQIPIPITFPIRLALDPEETRPKTDGISPKKLWTDPDRTPPKRN